MDTITITFDVYAPKTGKPATVHVGAAVGEGSPFFLTGTFFERHALLDQAYGAALKAGARAEARAEKSKTAAKAKKKSKASDAPAFGKPGHLPSHTSDEDDSDAEQTAAPEESGPIGPEATHEGTTTPVVDEPAELPAIEGDDDGQIEMELEGQSDD